MPDAIFGTDRLADQDEDADQHRRQRHEGAVRGNVVGAELKRHAGDGGDTEDKHRDDAAGGDADQDADADHRSQVIDADDREADTLQETLGEGPGQFLLHHRVGKDRQPQEPRAQASSR